MCVWVCLFGVYVSLEKISVGILSCCCCCWGWWWWCGFGIMEKRSGRMFLCSTGEWVRECGCYSAVFSIWKRKCLTYSFLHTFQLFSPQLSPPSLLLHNHVNMWHILWFSQHRHTHTHINTYGSSTAVDLMASTVLNNILVWLYKATAAICSLYNNHPVFLSSTFQQSQTARRAESSMQQGGL